MKLKILVNMLLVLAVVMVGAAGCGGDKDKQSSKTTITISGAFALYPMVVRWTEEYNKLHSDVVFDVSAGGAGKGMTDVLSGAADMGMVSRELRPEETGQGAVGFAVAKDAVVATINAKNPALDAVLRTGLSRETGAAIWLAGTTTTWGALTGSESEEAIHVYTRADACGAAEVWALYLGGKAQEDLLGTAVNGDPGLAEAVRQDALGIGFNNIGFAYDPATGKPVEGLRVVPLDLNDNGQIDPDEDFYADKTALTAAIAEGCYPSPPARPLYLVTKGQPNAAVTAFLRWVLTDGQAYVDATGYVQLTADLLQAGVAQLDRK